MYLLIVFFPVFSFLVTMLAGRFLGSALIRVLSPLFIFLSLIVTIFCFYEVVICGYFCIIPVFDWVNFGLLNFKIEFLFDSLTISMMIVVLTISFLVHLYSVEYMAEDPHLNRFLGFLTLFTTFMVIFITSSNFIQLFLGWEGIGLSSYLLINFWYTRVEANRSAMKAVILNRFGDFGLYMSILIIFFFFKSLDFNLVFSLSNYFYNFNNYFFFFNKPVYLFSFITFFLFLASIGKSAQIGLHVWLPDAMEGPTPVSALIHAATMVTAGIFLLIRMSPLIEYSKDFLIVISFFGAITVLFSSTIGIVQNDIKRVIAYSTCSQLGYMMFSCGISSYEMAFFHLFNHAFFKALLFLGAGSIIHSLFNEQDLRKYGGLLNLLPFSYISLLIGSLSLSGFPFLSGFYSKDLIIEVSYTYFSISGLFIYWLGSLSVFFTTFYSFRLIYLVFFSEVNFVNRNIALNVNESFFLITIVLSVLSFFSIFFGYLFFDIFVGTGNSVFSGVIFNNLDNDINLVEFLPMHIKLCPLFFSFLGLVFFLLICYYSSLFYSSYKNYLVSNLYFFLSKKWYFDNIFFWFVIKPFLMLSYNIFFKIIDRGIFEFLGPLGLVRFVRAMSIELNFFQKGFLFFSFLILIIIFLFFSLGIKNFLIIFIFLTVLCLFSGKNAK